MNECELSIDLMNSAPKHRSTETKRKNLEFAIRNSQLASFFLHDEARICSSELGRYHDSFPGPILGVELWGVTREGATRTASSSIVVAWDCTEAGMGWASIERAATQRIACQSGVVRSLVWLVETGMLLAAVHPRAGSARGRLLCLPCHLQPLSLLPKASSLVQVQTTALSWQKSNKRSYCCALFTFMFYFLDRVICEFVIPSNNKAWYIAWREMTWIYTSTQLCSERFYQNFISISLRFQTKS
jgi:hypothetical protein